MMSDPETPRSRLRFDSVERELSPKGMCRVSVSLEWGGETHTSSVEEVATQHGLIKAAAQAALESALEVAGDVDIELLGVKAVRAFDGWVVVARLSRDHDDRLLGAAPCEVDEDLPRAAVLAVLDATNRILDSVLRARVRASA